MHVNCIVLLAQGKECFGQALCVAWGPACPTSPHHDQQHHHSNSLAAMSCSTQAFFSRPWPVVACFTSLACAHPGHGSLGHFHYAEGALSPNVEGPACRITCRTTPALASRRARRGSASSTTPLSASALDVTKLGQAACCEQTRQLRVKLQSCRVRVRNLAFAVWCRDEQCCLVS